MSEIVKISLNHLPEGGIVWPQRCPECGLNRDLIYISGRVGAHNDRGSVEDMVVASLVRAETRAFHIPFPICKRHAFRQQLRLLILEKAVLMCVVRFSIYLSFLVFCSFAYKAATYQLSLSMLFANGVQDSFLFVPAIGLFGLVIIFWARKTSSVRFVGIDLSNYVLKIAFKDKKYSQDFKRNNSGATNARVTVSKIFFFRKDFWTWVLFLAFCIFVYQYLLNA